MRAFTYAWLLPVTWQRLQSQHSIRYSQKPRAACKLHGLMFYRTRVMADRSFTLREYAFSTFLLLWPWPWPDDLHVWTWPVFHRDVKIWISYVKAFESYHLRDTQTRLKIYTTPLCGCSIRSCWYQKKMSIVFRQDQIQMSPAGICSLSSVKNIGFRCIHNLRAH